MNPIIENLQNLQRIWNMAKITIKEEFLGAKLGIFWEVIRTGVFFTIYAMFFLLIKPHTGSSVKAELNLLGLFAALLPWNLVSTVINQTPRVYYRNKILVSTIKFPLSIIPTFDIVAKYIIHLVTLLIVVIIFIIYKHISFTFFEVLYYYICLFCLLIGMMFTLSLVCSISNDAYKFWQVIARVFIYLNPIFWSIKDIPGILHPILKANPFVYIFEGFKNIMAHNGHIEFGLYGLYFWCATAVIFAIGLLFQNKLRKVLPDVL